MKQKEYIGSCYIGVVGSENEIGECRDSIESITRRKRDTRPQYVRATKGYEARQMHLNNWYDGTKHPFLLLLDHDMKFPAFTLERLRSFRLPYISGFYMRRRYNPMAPVWFEYTPQPQMPMIPYTGVPVANTLYKIGASGWGCILLHRDVVTAMRKILKGEPEIIEDDMDLYPYDLKKTFKAMQVLDRYFNNPATVNLAEAQKHYRTIRTEIRPLRGLKDSVGSDIRFPFYARLAGFDMHGDSGVVCEHMLNYPLSAHDYIGQSAANVRDVTIVVRQDAQRETEKIQKALAEL